MRSTGRGARCRGALAVVLLAAASMGVAGCARLSPDGGMLVVEAAASAELGKEVKKIGGEADAAALSARVRALLAKPLTVSGAVQIALFNNRALQAAFNELGISDAELAEASLPPSPTLSWQRIVGSGGFEIERQIVQNVLALLTLPRRREIAEARFRQAQARAVAATLGVSLEAARAYYGAVAGNEAVKGLEEARLSAESVSEVAKQLGETGAMSKLDQAREHAFYAEVSAQLASARLRQRRERERLIRALGLWGGDTKFTLPTTLAALPHKPRTPAAVEQDAVRRRADLVVLRLEVDILALQLGLTRKTRIINALEVAGVSKTEKDIDPATGEADKIKRRGFEVDLEIPIYDFGEARLKRAEETYMAAVNRLLARAVNARSEAREAYEVYRAAYDIARHYEREVLPLRRIIAEETLLNYNAMIRDLFALLAEARARIAANTQAIEARRDFWLAPSISGRHRRRARPARGATGQHAGRHGDPGTTDIHRSAPMPLSRRAFLASSGLTLASVGPSAARLGDRVAAGGLPEVVTQSATAMQPPLNPTPAHDYQPVVTLNGWTLPWRQNGDWKEFHLVAEPVVREIAPGMKAHLWGYNGQSPGPTHRSRRGRQGSHLRHQQASRTHHNALARHAGAQRHGWRRWPDPATNQAGQDIRLRVRAQGQRHLHVPPALRRDGADGDGHDGHVHRASARSQSSARRSRLRLSARRFRIDPGSYVPKVAEMLDFNLWTFNCRVFPGIDHLAVRKGDRVRVRIGNLTMTNHPIHMHGHHFAVTCTDGGWVPESARWPEATIDMPVGPMRAFDFHADYAGDWALHCHKSHHTMNAMGHDVQTYIGVDLKRHAEEDLARGRRRLQPMGSTAAWPIWAAMEMPAARQHAADDDRLRPVRAHRDGRHVHRRESARGPRRQRLQGPRLVPASPRAPSPTNGTASGRRQRARRRRRPRPERRRRETRLRPRR